MKIVGKTAHSDIATVYIGQMIDQKMIEFVESTQPPFPIEEKWVILISTLFGCPVKCPMCDAGGNFSGKLTGDEMFQQIEYLIRHRFNDQPVTAKKFKIQFARMGEPALNNEVIQVLGKLPQRLDYTGILIPSISTIAPRGTEGFFEELLTVKNELYHQADFQMQFSLHSTDQEQRDHMIPIDKWNFQEIADYGRLFWTKKDRKITLNFALNHHNALDPAVIEQYFDPDLFLIKITPVNPTVNAAKNRIGNIVLSKDQTRELPPVKELESMGYDLIISLGELEENKIGSNCGQYLKHYQQSNQAMPSSYTYQIQ